MYSIRQAADLLGVQPKLLRRCVAEGQFPGATAVEGKHGAPSWRIPEEALQQWRAREPSAPGPAPRDSATPRSEPRDRAMAAPRQRSEAEILAPFLQPPAPVEHAAPRDHLMPMSVVVELLRAEADQRRSAQRIAEEQAATIAVLRQGLETEREEVLRLRRELEQSRQALQEAQRGLLRVTRKPQPPVDHDRETQPLDMQTLMRIAQAN